MLAVLQLDAVSVPLVDRLLAEGRLPALAELLAAGRRSELKSTADYLPAAAYPTLYSGLPPAEHGLHYVFQWSPDEQRVRFRDEFPSPPAVWERLAAAGRRSLVLDPYEMWRPRHVAGDVVCGWQFENPLSLESWSAPVHTHSMLRRSFGRPRKVNEVFGRITASYALAFLERLIAASARIATGAEELLRANRYDLAWITFLAPHIGGHLFWDPDVLATNGTADASTRDTLGHALVDVYEETDRALARVLDALPDDADVLVLSPMGMGVNLSRVDFLPAMLASVLAADVDGSPRRASSTEALLWRLRAAVPTRVRAAVASAAGGRLARELTARMSSVGVDWNETRAFMVPSDHYGQIRLNLRGRERDGIVSPAEQNELCALIAEGLLGFRDPDGHPAVESVLPVANVAGDGRATRLLPDLVVRWAARDATRLTHVRSERHGRIDRLGAGTGRTGAHTEDAWILAVPRRRRLRRLDRTPRLEDVAATACALFETATDGLVGEPLLE